MEGLNGLKRTMYCADVSTDHAGRDVCLMGWVQKRRDHGGLIFVDLRDREGMAQVVFDPAESKEAHKKAHSLRAEFVIAITGKVTKRPAGTENPALRTGYIEVRARELKILNESEPLPFMIEDTADVGEDVRLKYRYLDLRRPRLQKNIILRHRVCQSVRAYLIKMGFIEVETPMLTKSTPEGARDFLVPSRLSPGRFYALPQSPQLFKQILMIAGFDRYFQIVRCFRDEDLRSDRQPEFTQVDAEMSFVDKSDVMDCMEGLIIHVFKDVSGMELKGQFKRLTHEEALSRYGLDSPDVRFGLELKDISDIAARCGFKVFSDSIKDGGIVKAVNAKGSAEFSRTVLDELTGIAASFGGKGLAWVKITNQGWQSPIAKFFKDEEKIGIAKKLEAEAGDLLLFSADKKAVVNAVLGRVRLSLAKRLNMIPNEGFSFVWVTDFPLFEYDEHEKKLGAMHHPFTSPMDEDLELLDTNPLKARAKAYDMVLNGTEIGGGSIRIHNPTIQSKVFETLGITKEDAREKFGFLLDALSFGTPPHGGIAFGLDRLIAMMVNAESIRDVIAFPKTQKATCLMSEAPSTVNQKQLDELSIKAVKKG